MNIAYYSHPDCLLHEIAAGHPEQANRVRVIDEALQRDEELAVCLRRLEAPLAATETLKLAHSETYVDALLALNPAQGQSIRLDEDTAINAWSLQAARRAAGAVVAAVDAVLDGSQQRAFCNVRPPGHHAEHGTAMGFCLFNSIAIGALHALERHGLQRVAVVDFDVHFGNGTSNILRIDPRVLLLSSCQYPLYPLHEIPQASASEINIILPSDSDGNDFRTAVERQWLPALEAFDAELVLISAGFDAHADDPLAGLRWQAEDYAWITQQICQTTKQSALGRVVSSLEGGYHLKALASCALAHTRALAELNNTSI
ncbi:MAG: histone deacetylase family protein [Oceanococcus sp.]